MLNTKRSFVAAVTCLYLTSIISASAHAGVTDDLYSAAKTLAHDAKSAAQIAKRKVVQKLTSNRIEGSFEDIYPKPFLQTTTGKTALIGGSAVVVATIAYFTAGTGLSSAGPIATWVGTQVGMATGVGSGATAAGLAILGGGTIASGGLGIAGGIAVIAAISDVGIMIALDQATDALPPDLANPTTKYRLLKVPLPKKANDRVLEHFKMAEKLVDGLKEMDATQPEYVRTSTKISGHYSSALNELQNIDPKSATAGYDYIARAVLEFNFMDYGKARESLHAAERYTKNGAFSLYMYTLIRLTMSDKDALSDAAKWLDVVTRADPSAIQPYILQTIVHMDRDDPGLALQKALIGLENVDDNFELNWRAAEIAFHNVNNYSTAADLYEEALSNVSQNEMEAHCKMMVALSYDRQNNREEALDWYEEAIDEIKGSPDQVTKMSELWNNLKQEK